MIVFKVLRADAGALPYLGQAKGYMRRVIEGLPGLEAVIRNWRVGDVTLRARAVKFAGDWIVKLWLEAAATGTTIAYPLESTSAFTATGHSLAALRELHSLSLASDNIAFNSATLEALTLRYAFLSAITFSDEGAENVTGVHATPLYPHCDVVITRGVTAAPTTAMASVTTALIDRLFEDRHYDALADLVPLALTVETPAAVADVMNAYTSIVWTPCYFWKEGDDVWAMCRCTALDGSIYTTNPTAPGSLIPYTGIYDNDRFVVSNFAALEGGGYSDDPGPSAWQQLPFIFLKAKMIDLATYGGFGDERSIDEPIGGSIDFEYFGTTYAFPVDPSDTDGVVASTEEFETSAYRMSVRFTGRIQTVNGVERFIGTVAAVSFHLARMEWGTATRIDGGTELIFDYDEYTAEADLAFTSGVPFELGTIIDMRPVVYPTAPTYVRAWGRTSYNFRKEPDPLEVHDELAVQLWASPISGLGYSAFTTQEPGDYTAGSSLVSPILLSRSWGGYTSDGIAYTTTGAEVYSFTHENLEQISTFRTSDTNLVRENRGELEVFGVLNDSRVDAAGVFFFESHFIPAERFAAMGLTEYREAGVAPYQMYEGRVQAEVGYVEKLPLLWSATNPIDAAFYGSMGRYYNGVELEPPVLRAGTPTGMTLADTPLPHTYHSEYLGEGVSGVQAKFIGYYHSLEVVSAPATQSSITRAYWVDAIEYPYPTPFYAPESAGGAVVSVDGVPRGRPRYKAVAIYLPGLRDGEAGFCLLKLGPADQFIRTIYYHLDYTVAGLATLNSYIGALADFLGQPIFNTFPDYAANIAALNAMVAGLYARRESTNPPSTAELAELKALALTTLRSSYTVMANNFAPPELMDFFNTSVILIPPLTE